MLIKVPSKDTEVVVAALSRQVRKLPAELRRSLAKMDEADRKVLFALASRVSHTSRRAK